MGGVVAALSAIVLYHLANPHLLTFRYGESDLLEIVLSGAVACRYGGDEFVIAIPLCTPFLAHQVAEDLRLAVRDTAPLLSGRWFEAGTLSISVGAAWALFDRSEGKRS